MDNRDKQIKFNNPGGSHRPQHPKDMIVKLNFRANAQLGTMSFIV